MKGFTLIEVLAVIVILSIILIISVPIIGSTIDAVKENSFKIAVKHLEKAAEITYYGNKENRGREIIFEFNDYVVTSNYPDAKLEFSGQGPKNGNLIIRKDGKISYSFFNGEKCAQKSYDEKEAVITSKGSETCISEISLPSVVLIGNSPQYVEINDLYNELGVVAKTIAGEDIVDVAIKYMNGTDEIPSIPLNALGSYRVIYTVYEDEKTNYAERNVIVRDTIAPVINVPLSTSIVISEVNSFNMQTGVTLTDNSGEDLTLNVSGSIARIAGSYTITYSATDSSGNETTVERIINVNDIDAPVITLNGDSVVNLNMGDTYTELNATALDDADGDLTTSIVRSGTVNTSIAGTYLVTYTVKDSSNNEASVTRTVNVIDNVAPNIAFGTNGNTTYAKTRNTTVTVDDNALVVSRQYQWTTSTTAPSSGSFSTTFSDGGTIATPVGVSGTYYLWIKAVDNSSNETIIRSNAFNLDNEKPIIASVTNSSSGNWTNANVTLGWNSSDNASGIATMQFSYDKVAINPTSISQPSSNPLTWNSSDIWSTERDSIVYFRVVDAAGNISDWTAGTAVRIDKTAPVFTTLTSGYNYYTDTNFASGNNSMAVYNNLGNGLVTHTRTAMTTPTGSGYAVRITVTGAVEPGLGGFYQNTISRPNGVYVHKIIARIPVGYSIHMASNSIGNEASYTWITGNVGTGDWYEYIYVTRAGSTGSFSTLGHVWIAGPTPSPASPFVWDVAYTSLTDSLTYATSIDATFSGYDSGSGLTGYSYGTAGSPGTYTTISNRANFANVKTGYTTNQDVYAWLRDQAGNQASGLISINKVDRSGPTVTFSTNGNPAYLKTHSTYVTTSDSSLVVSRQYQWTTSTTAPSSASFSQVFSEGAYFETPAGGNYSYYLWIKAVDNLGNETITRSNVFNLDNGVPGISIVTNGGTMRPASTVVNCSDAINLFSSVVYAWTNSTTTPSSGWTSFTNGATLTQNVSGTWYLHVRVTDTAGNVNTVRSNAFTVASLLSTGGTSYSRVMNAEGAVATAGAANTSSWTLAREITATESGLFVVTASFWGYADSGYSLPEASFGVNGSLVGSVARGSTTTADPWDRYSVSTLSRVVNAGDKIQLWLRVDPSYATGATYSIGRFKTVTVYYQNAYGGSDPYPYTRTLN